MIKCRMMMARHAAGVKDMINVYKNLIGRPEGTNWA
jgi:hypothetical protein